MAATRPTVTVGHLKFGLLAVSGLLAAFASAATAAPRVDAVAPVPVPTANGTPACADARRFLQQLNADIAAYTESVARADARERQAQATLAAAKPGQKGNAEQALAQARDVVARLHGEGKRVQANANKLAATASAECMTAPPTPAQTTTEFAVPADNGTKECGSDRSQMVSLLKSIGHLRDTETNRELGPLGLSGVARDQIELQIKRLTAELQGTARKAAAACAAADFAGTWTGTYTQVSSPGCAGKTGRMTLTLTQTGSELSGASTDFAYNLCPDVVDLHGSVTGTVSGKTATITSVYDNNAGTYGGTFVLNGKTLTFKEDSGDSATLARG
jgi:hypothetical protein